MQVRKYVGATMPEALKQVKEDLGPDAIIFGSRQIRPKGMFGPAHIEVTAAVDDTPPAPLKGAFAGQGLGGGEREEETQVMDLRLRTLRNEIRGLREDLRVEEVEVAREMLVDQLEGVREILAAYSLKSVGGNSDWFGSILENADIAPDVVSQVAELARTRFQDLAADSVAAAKAGVSIQMQALGEVLAELLGRERYTGPSKNKVVALVGPTGAGKTTTVAKLAANAALVRKLRVGLITTDTFRVGAVEQLRHYADLIGVPVEAVSNHDEFAYAMNRFNRYDLVLIDTAGRNPSDSRQISGLVDMFQQYDVEVHLAVPAATRSYELQEILARFEALKPAATIVTKYDEARVIGAVVNTVVLGKMPISFVTMGQRVPEDITRPRPHAIAQRVIDSVMQFAGPNLRRTVEAEYNHLEQAVG